MSYPVNSFTLLCTVISSLVFLHHLSSSYICDSGCDFPGRGRLHRFFYIIGVAFHPSSGHEEGGFYIVFGKNVKNCLCIVIAPGSVKTNRYLRFFGFYTINREFESSWRAAYCDDIRKVSSSTKKQKSCKGQGDKSVKESFRQNRVSYGRGLLLVYSLISIKMLVFFV